jgi:hypothetical protein
MQVVESATTKRRSQTLNGDEEALKNCPPPKKQEVCVNADSGDEPPELLVRPGDEEATDLEHEQPELLVRLGR